MDTKSLMIGDLVRHANGNVCVVSKVEQGRGFACRIGNSDYLWNYNNKFESIPITEGILKANGYEQYGHHSMLYVNENTPDEVSIHIDYKESIEIDAPSYKYSGWCENVHELQHALRLCGLNELADNFKIKTMEE